MKFNFKIQQFQTEAVDSVVQVFNGQRNHRPESYLRDLGSGPADIQPYFDENLETTDDRTGYKNAPIELSDEQLPPLRQGWCIWREPRAPDQKSLHG